MEVDITALRKTARSLWLTHFNHEYCADLLGGGGGIFSDRLQPEWMRDFGAEIEQKEE